MKCKNFILSLFLSFLLFILSLTLNICKIEGHAEQITTPSGHPDFTQADSYSVLEDIDWQDLASTAFKLKGIIKPSFTGTLAGFVEYDLNNNNTLTAHPTIGIRNNADGTKTYDIDKEIRQEIFNYINSTYVDANPLQYTSAYIYSYAFLNPSSFPTYAMYKSVQTYIKESNCWCVLFMTYNNGQCLVMKVNTDSHDIGLVGTVQASGSFSGVQIYDNWNLIGNNVTVETFQQNGTHTSGGTNWGGTNVSNSNSPSNSAKIIISPLDKNELVYVFKNLNAYKNFNVGLPQNYYLRDNWSNIVDDNNYIGSDELQHYGNAYNEVVNNVQNGWSAEDVLLLVDKILNNTSSGSSTNNDDILDLGFLGKIGSIIGKVITGIGNLITGVLEGIANALIGENGDGGILGLVTNVLSSLTELISEDFGEFINGLFSFMPSEIRTILVAGFTISVFLGVLRLIRK